MTTTITTTPEKLVVDPASIPVWARGAEAASAGESEDGQIDAYDLFRDGRLIGSLYTDSSGPTFVERASVADDEWPESDMLAETYQVHCGGGSIEVYRYNRVIHDNARHGDARLGLVLTRRPTEPAPHVVMTSTGGDRCVARLEDGRLELVDDVEVDWFESFEPPCDDRAGLAEWLHSRIHRSMIDPIPIQRAEREATVHAVHDLPFSKQARIDVLCLFGVILEAVNYHVHSEDRSIDERVLPTVLRLMADEHERVARRLGER